MAVGYTPEWWALLTAIEHVQHVTNEDFEKSVEALMLPLREGKIKSRYRGQPLGGIAGHYEGWGGGIAPELWYRAGVYSDATVEFRENLPTLGRRSGLGRPRHDVEVWRAHVLQWWPEASPSDATLPPKPDRETREARRGDWIKRFAGRQRIARRWIAFADLTDWCAHSTTGAGRAEEDQARDLAWQRIAQSILNGEFERNSRSEVLYLDPRVLSDGGSARCRLTSEQFRSAFDIAATPPAPSLPMLALVCCWLPRELARQWIETHGYRWPPHFDQKRSPTVSVPGERVSSKRWRPGRSRHWKPLAEAIGAVARRRGVSRDQAWTMLNADIAATEIKARCRSRRYDHQQGTWIETSRDFDPRWLGFVAYEFPEDNHLCFDLPGAIRARMAGEQLGPPPEHAWNIVVDAARLDELHPRRGWRKPRQSPLRQSPLRQSPLRQFPLKDVEAAVSGSAPVQQDGKKLVTRRPSRQKPFWPEARKAALKWLEENGFPRPGDGEQSKLEEHIARCGYEAAKSTIRKHVKGWIEEYKASLPAPE